MSYAEKLARLVYGVTWVVIALLGVWLVSRIVAGDLPFESRIDPQTGTAGLLVETDAGTGCQYIVTPWGGIVQRTALDGKQVCVAKH